MKTNEPPKTLSSLELDKFINQIKSWHWTRLTKLAADRNYLMILLMADAGLRVGEIVRLKQTDLLREDEPVTNLIIRAETTKTKCERIIPLSERTRKATIDFNDSVWKFDPSWRPSWAFYNNNQSSHISTRQIQRICESAGKISIGRKVNPHMLRHTFASRTMRVASIRVVQQLLGHASLSSTQIYTHPNGDDLQKAISQLE